MSLPANDSCDRLHGILENPSDDINLGTLIEIKNRRLSQAICAICPICQLMLDALSDARIQASPPLSWRSIDNSQKSVVLDLHTSKRMGDYYTCSLLPVGTKIVCLNRSSSNARGRLITRTDIDPSIATSWLSACQAHHGARCSASQTQGRDQRQTHLRVIDVQQLCIVDVTRTSEYFALSYVWGSTQQYCLRRENAESLKEWGSLIERWQQIPQTIRDAIQLTQRMHRRYLWVDSLCLIQNDEDDMKAGVQSMDSIYELATLTIVAANGADAMAGLPGVRKGTRSARQLFADINSELSLLVVHELEAVLKGTSYNVRGWTFQEYCLSPRKLIFTNNLMYFQCKFCDWSEESDDDERPMVESWGQENLLSQAIRPEMMPPYDGLCMLIQYFGGRQLTHQKDALSAMAGITARFNRQMKCRSYEGFPVAVFDFYLLFTSSESSFCRRNEFPSYSWAGWKGTCDWGTICDMDSEHLNQWLAEDTWIIWYKRTWSGSLRLVWDIEANEEFSQATAEDVGYRRRSSFPQKYALGIRTSRTQSTQNMFVASSCTYNLLQFWTMSVFCRIQHQDDPNFPLTRYWILDRRNRFCGALLMDGEAFQPSQDQILEFILLSTDGTASGCSVMELESFKARTQEDDYAPCRMFNAMLVEWKDGIAERKGMGQIYQTALGNSFPPGAAWKEFILG